MFFQNKFSTLRVTEINTLRPRQDGRHFPDDIFKWIFLNENVWISNNISMKFVPKGPINNIPALVQIMAWRRSGDKPLSEPMMVRLPTHICVTRPQWVKAWISNYNSYILWNKFTYPCPSIGCVSTKTIEYLREEHKNNYFWHRHRFS